MGESLSDIHVTCCAWKKKVLRLTKSDFSYVAIAVQVFKVTEARRPDNYNTSIRQPHSKLANLAVSLESESHMSQPCLSS